MRIGVFDSGIGGLTVLKPLIQSKFFTETIYFGDTARVPYGGKDKNIIIRYALEAVEFFKNFDIQILIVACNTVSAYALDFMRKEATFEVYGVIESGVLAVEKYTFSHNKRPEDLEILVIGTKGTIKSEIYNDLLKEKNYQRIENLPTGLFVPIVEEEIFHGEILTATFEHYFKNIETPDVIVLGCTHFPLISDEIKKYFLSRENSTKENIFMVHSGEAIIDFLTSKYNFKEKFNSTEMKFFASENPSNLKRIANHWLGMV